MSTLQSVNRPATRGRGEGHLYILRETVQSIIHLRRLGNLKGHEGLLSFSHKPGKYKAGHSEDLKWVAAVWIMFELYTTHGSQI